MTANGRFLPGTRIAGRYRIVSLAGRGGMGEVDRADDLKLGHPVALKFLPREVEEGSRSFQHFLGEVRLSRQIAHPNVCRVHDIAEVDGQHFLSMEYIPSPPTPRPGTPGAAWRRSRSYSRWRPSVLPPRKPGGRSFRGRSSGQHIAEDGAFPIQHGLLNPG